MLGRVYAGHFLFNETILKVKIKERFPNERSE